MPTLPSDRIPYSAIVDRPPLKLPDGARLIVWTIVNVEEWSAARPMPRTVLPPPMGKPLEPDLPNWAWHEYGMRVGFWRLLDCMKAFDVGVTLALNGRVCEAYPRVAEAALKAGWEFMGHGWEQRPMHHVEDEVAAIGKTIAAIERFTGRKPRGWESPGLTETHDTIDHLAAAGIEYVANWVLDDQPCEISTRHGPMVSIPYSVEINDVAISAVQQHSSAEYYTRAIEQFERLYKESARITRVMAISVHPYLNGVPHRIGYLEKLYQHIREKPGVLLWRGEQVLDWYRQAKG
jgi:peptidoglycan/xylan/chitin deacetylase (PgdA/CDA1 family)